LHVRRAANGVSKSRQLVSRARHRRLSRALLRCAPVSQQVAIAPALLLFRGSCSCASICTFNSGKAISAFAVVVQETKKARCAGGFGAAAATYGSLKVRKCSNEQIRIRL
jgi:hypothetical protein